MNYDEPAQPPLQALRGVNLGGWLVLEKWITPSLFAGTNALDEYSLAMAAATGNVPGLEARIADHRRTFITKADFIWLQQQRIEAVRLPIGSWIFGDESPYSGAIEYVDQAFTWAKQTGLRILLDLHGVPGSQNGLQESGRIGLIQWHTKEAHVISSLRIIEDLAERYGNHPSLLGIELLNEPHRTVPRRVLLRYYEAAYQIIRAKCRPDTWVVFSDGFRPRRWKHKLKPEVFPHTYIDSHQYQIYTKSDKRLDVEGHIKKTVTKVQASLNRMQRYHPAIVGEWSLALDPTSVEGLSADQLQTARKAYGAVQLFVYATTKAWFYWTYKTETQVSWDFRSMVEQGNLT